MVESTQAKGEADCRRIEPDRPARRPFERGYRGRSPLARSGPGAPIFGPARPERTITSAAPTSSLGQSSGPYAVGLASGTIVRSWCRWLGSTSRSKAASRTRCSRSSRGKMNFWRSAGRPSDEHHACRRIRRPPGRPRRIPSREHRLSSFSAMTDGPLGAGIERARSFSLGAGCVTQTATVQRTQAHPRPTSAAVHPMIRADGSGTALGSE